ncbi:hypothetical protein GCM10020220_073560 [Nonomuraea rubra]
MPIKIAVINNGNLGMVRQWQTLFYEERYSNTNLQAPAASLTSSSSRRPMVVWACGASVPRTWMP